MAEFIKFGDFEEFDSRQLISNVPELERALTASIDVLSEEEKQLREYRYAMGCIRHEPLKIPRGILVAGSEQGSRVKELSDLSSKSGSVLTVHEAVKNFDGFNRMILVIEPCLLILVYFRNILSEGPPL